MGNWICNSNASDLFGVPQLYLLYQNPFRWVVSTWVSHQVAISKSARKNLRDFCRMSGGPTPSKLRKLIPIGSWSEFRLQIEKCSSQLAWQGTFYKKDGKTCHRSSYRSINYRTWGILQFTGWINNKWSSSIAGVKWSVWTVSARWACGAVDLKEWYEWQLGFWVFKWGNTSQSIFF